MKYLITALIFIGALFFKVNAQDDFNPCPLGGTYDATTQICYVAQQSKQDYKVWRVRAQIPSWGWETFTGENAIAQFNARLIAVSNNGTSYPNCTRISAANFRSRYTSTLESGYTPTQSTTSLTPITRESHRYLTTCDTDGNNDVYEPVEVTYQQLNDSVIIDANLQNVESCPPDQYPMFTDISSINGLTVCSTPAAVPDNDVEPDPNCPEGTIGGCEPQDKCVEGGNGMLVCQADPDEKCQVSDSATIGPDGNPLPAYSNCDAGCGFVDQVFMCATEPDGVPNFEKCEITSTGYACPSDNENKDDLSDPEKPVSDLKKSDLKEVNQGLEKRQDLNNELLETQLAQDKNIADQNQKTLDGIGGKIDAVTGAVNTMNNNLGDKLDGIGESLDGIGDAFKPGEGNIQGNGNAESWWDSEYPDGIKSVWDKHSSAIQQTEFMNFLDSFRLNTTGVQPDMQFCFNLGKLGNYGCKQLVVPDIIWPAIRIFILITAAFAVRKIIFGG